MIASVPSVFSAVKISGIRNQKGSFTTEAAEKSKHIHQMGPLDGVDNS